MWHGIAVMCHSPMIKAKSVIEIGKCVIANTGLPNCVNVIDGEAMSVQMNCAVGCRCCPQRVACNDQLSTRQLLQRRKNLSINALICVVKARVTITAIAPLILVARRREDEHIIDPCLKICIGTHESHNSRTKSGVITDNRAGIGIRTLDLCDVLEARNRLARNA